MKKLLMLIALSYGCVAAPTILEVKNTTMTIDGKSITTATIEQQNGTWGYIAPANGVFDVLVKNKLAESTVIHWHGLILPNQEDGVDGVTQAQAIPPNGEYHYKFKLQQSGTYWMHSHYGMQEQLGVEAPLILTTSEDQKYQQVVVMFQDFSFKTPAQIMAQLNHSNESAAAMMGHHGHMASVNAAESIDKSAEANHSMAMSDMADMGSMNMDDMDMSGMDINDVAYDAFLTNYHSDANPQIVTVKPGALIKLRFINGASATNFWINLGKLTGDLVAVDGQNIKPLTGSKFQLALGQRADIIVKIPKAGGDFKIWGQVEGLTAQTGIILTTNLSSTQQLTLESQAPTTAPALNYAEEQKLVSAVKIIPTANKISLNLKITGNMTTYQWQLNGQSWPNITPLRVKQGDTVRLTFDNQSMMAHPMHLHGYDFKIVAIDGKKIDGAIRDTVLVLPHSQVTVEFVADAPGKWMLHCHMLYHMASGMMTYLEVTDK